MTTVSMERFNWQSVPPGGERQRCENCISERKGDCVIDKNVSQLPGDVF